MAERRLFEDVADAIRRLILDGVYPPGTRLPGERELSERFEVSRVTIREAEIALQATGWIHIRTGAGAYVQAKLPGDGGILPQVSAFELTEARSLFEAEAAALAAPTISAETLAKLEGLLEAMANEDASEDEISVIDREFHMTIAAASNNKAIIHVIESLWRMRLELPEVRTSHSMICRKDGAARQAEHAGVVEALRKRDAGGARLAMRRHFNRLLESMLDETEERAMVELRQRAAESRERYLLSAKLA
ncbi:FadR/GntR family transcriptional regulator [Sphingopyxis sp. 113P3]|jgi:Transcriptional regulators|uniref:FadR/GntR family transcriptional regulator n=1 Tax=Sphingopyxis sp. (strain 113P3) TaxID=292913 RepID=UPI0006AD36A3|nr:FCD domain-containing protein [Sphingopyxis sp. 113P3]ALC10399.1 GntR family transcriptional regulator [Sphingopyxis sp. 113P3]